MRSNLHHFYILLFINKRLKIDDKITSKDGNWYTKKLIKNKEFYFEFANKAFENVKYDMKLYNKMKNNYWQFCKDIMKLLKEDPSLFDSKILD